MIRYLRTLSFLLVSCVALLPNVSNAGMVGLSLNGTGTDYLLSGNLFDPAWFNGAPPTEYDLGTMRQGDSLLLNTNASNLTYTYIGREAAYTNLFQSFYIPAQQISASSGFGTSISFSSVSQGPLDFGFLSNGVDGPFNNGSDRIGLMLAKDNQSALILFNDQGSDSDFDDMVIRVSITPVPEPGTYAMLLAGLGLMGTIARRRKTNS